MTPDSIRAEYVKEYKLKLNFEDGREGIVDFQPLINKGSVFSTLGDM
jgi:hypothetical protein